MEFGFTVEQETMRNLLRDSLDEVCTDAYLRRCDEEHRYPKEVFELLAELGFYGLAFPVLQGGTGGSAIDMLIVAEELGRKSYDLAAAYALTVFNGLNLLKIGTEEQKRHYIPLVISGQIKFSISITEPDAGSDVAAIRTTARLEGDRFVINGQKVFSSAADQPGNVINLVCRTLKGSTRHEGLSLILVDPHTPGVEIRRLKTLGRWMLGTNEIFFTDAEVPADRLVGPLHQGWQALMGCLRLERAFAAAAYCGNAQTVVDEALQYARDRQQFGRSIGDFQSIAHMLADMQTEVDMVRLLCYRAAWMVEQGVECTREVSMAKLAGSETFARVANMGMQIMGGYGYMMDFNMQRYFRDARICTVTAGTSQIQRNIIARTMGLRPK